jgi:large subunit ribosomal protein L15
MLHTFKPNPGSKKTSRRVARGNGSGRGTTAGRGTKGQQSRVGKGRRLGFEGGQTPFLRRQPKLGGFKRPMRVDMEILNLDVLEAKVPAGSHDYSSLRSLKVIGGRKPVKLLGRGTVTKKFELKVQAASKSAREAIKKAGGSITIVKLING